MYEDTGKVQQPIVEALEAAVTRDDLPKINEILSRWNYHLAPNVSSTSATDDRWPLEVLVAKAIEQSKPAMVSRALDLGLKLGRFHIERALDNPSAEVFQAFHDHGWDLNAPLSETEPPVLAYVIQDENLVQWFLSQGASPNIAPPRLARTPVMAAGVYGSLNTMKLLFAHGALNLDVLQSAAESPIADRLPIMEFILEKGADIDAVKWRHHQPSFEAFSALELGTALHYAAKNGYVDRVELLLRRGADKSVLDSTGRTALQLAEAYGRRETVALLN
ncbi:MAG: hypothetical protein Q9223_006139, partial [Gallowayella weberi]